MRTLGGRRVRRAKHYVAIASILVLALALVAIAFGPSNLVAPAIKVSDSGASTDTPATSDSLQSISSDPESGSLKNPVDTVSRTVLDEGGQVFLDADAAKIIWPVVREYLSARPIDKYRIVTVDADQIRTHIRAQGSESDFEVSLLDDAKTSLQRSASDEGNDGWQAGIGAWLGHIDSDRESFVQFVLAPDGTINGVLRSSTIGRVEIEPIRGTPHHLMWSMAPDFERQID